MASEGGESSPACKSSVKELEFTLVLAQSCTRGRFVPIREYVMQTIMEQSVDDVTQGLTGETVLAAGDPPTLAQYDAAQQLQGMSQEAILASLGSTNPMAVAQLHTGETVLDLGSGAGINVLLSARRVGPSGKVYGLDTTDEALSLARSNREVAGVTNVEFLQGRIENIPLPDSSINVVISNGAINLSPDQNGVLAEAFRVLKPGGRLNVTDVVWFGDAGNSSGVLEENDYLERLAAAGFKDASITPTRLDEEQGGHFMDAFIRARKPTTRA